MSNKTQTDGFGWDELWSAFSMQTPEIQREWMLGLHESIEDRTKRSPGLHKMLVEIMEYGSEKVKDEVFEAAPDDVKKYFKYKVQRQSPPSRLMTAEDRQALLRLLG